MSTIYNIDTVSESSKTTKERQKDQEVERNNNLEKMNTLDIYARRMDRSHWALTLKFETENHFHNYINKILYRIAKIFYTCDKSYDKHLINKHETVKIS